MPRIAATNRQVVRDFGTCLDFNGSSALVTMATAVTDTNQFTFSCWFKRSDSNPNWIVGNSSGTQKIGFFGGTNNTNVFVRIANAGSSTQINVGYTIEMDNKWHFLCVVRNSSNVISASLDGGTFVTGSTISGTFFYDQVAKDNATDFFSGSLDEIRFFTSDLTQAQATALYYGVTPSTSSNLWYRFNEGSGTSATDSSGTQSAGTITNATYSTNVRFKLRSSASILGIQLDGSQNHMSMGALGNLGSSLGSGFYAAFSLRTTATTSQCVIGGGNSGSTTAALIYINATSGGSVNDNRVRVFLRADDGKLIDCGTSADYVFNDGKFHNFVITADGATNTVTVTIDGNSQGITYGTQTTPATFSNFTHALALGTRNNAGSFSGYLNGLVKNVSVGTSAGALYGVYSLTGNVLDTSGNNNHGTLIGSPPPLFVSRTVIT